MSRAVPHTADGSGRPLVTIGICTYNRADGYLRQALQSALDQTYPHLEIIVSDNCSTDETAAVVARFADPRIRYFRQRVNIGANDNFNFCLQQAAGVYFLLLHDDDLIDPDFVDACMEAVRGDPTVGIIRTGTRVIDADGAVLWNSVNRVGGCSTTDFILGWFAGRTALYLCSTLFNTAQLRQIGGFSSRTLLFQDVVAEMRLAAMYGRADVPDVKASFRRHHHNLGSAARLDDWVEDSVFLLNVMCELVPEERRREVQRKGMAYFARRSYRYVKGISPLFSRVGAYNRVDRRFAYAYSPLRYILGQSLRHVKRRIQR